MGFEGSKLLVYFCEFHKRRNVNMDSYRGLRTLSGGACGNVLSRKYGKNAQNCRGVKDDKVSIIYTSNRYVYKRTFASRHYTQTADK